MERMSSRSCATSWATPRSTRPPGTAVVIDARRNGRRRRDPRHRRRARHPGRVPATRLRLVLPRSRQRHGRSRVPGSGCSCAAAWSRRWVAGCGRPAAGAAARSSGSRCASSRPMSSTPTSPTSGTRCPWSSPHRAESSRNEQPPTEPDSAPAAISQPVPTPRTSSANDASASATPTMSRSSPIANWTATTASSATAAALTPSRNARARTELAQPVEDRDAHGDGDERRQEHADGRCRRPVGPPTT